MKRMFAGSVAVALLGGAGIAGWLALRPNGDTGLHIVEAFAETEAQIIEACKAYANAQDQFRRVDHDQDGVLEYADKSEDLLKAGLIDEDFAMAFDVHPSKHRPYHGYYFRIVTEQGDDAPGGARDYYRDGYLTQGYALLAYPVAYGARGRMSYAISNTGTIHSFDLGLDTEHLAQTWVYGARHASPADRAEAPVLRLAGDAFDETKTRVSAVLSAPIAEGENLIWCASFQMAWDELRKFLGGDVKLSGAPPLAALLNARSANAAYADLASTFVHAGKGSAAVKTIAEGMAARFPGEFEPPFTAPATEDDLFAFAFLSKDLAFPRAFARPPEALKFEAEKVLSFGVWENVENGDELRKQVVVWDYVSDAEFVAELRTKSDAERFLIARIPPRETLEATVRDVLRRTAKPKAMELHERERFEMPVLNLDVTRTFGELTNRGLVGHPGYTLTGAQQQIRFKVDEHGARLHSLAELWVIANGDEPARPRMLVCNGPFLILLMEKGRADPYFALWIGNARLLAKVQE